jgi:dihydroneopterin aldolase/2-amino-4-hydroxy-6-hydroxymethyldihydropteridine diphosphokinase
MSADRIELSGVRLVIPVGVLPEEHARMQPVEIDVVMEVDMSVSGRTDRLEGTVDYGAVIARIEQILTTNHHQLLERAATVVAEDILRDAKVSAVEVCVRKLRPPVPQDVAHTAARIRRERTMSSTVSAGHAVADAPGPGSSIQRAYLALGSNLGDRLGYLRLALDDLNVQVVARSRVYETDPIGGPGGQGAFLNMVIAVDTPLDPYALLRRCRAIETAARRVRAERNGPRTLDVDVLLYEGTAIVSDELTIPHPRMYERRFVLEPLADIAPELCPEGWRDRVDLAGVAATDLVP